MSDEEKVVAKEEKKYCKDCKQYNRTKKKCKLTDNYTARKNTCDSWFKRN